MYTKLIHKFKLKLNNSHDYFTKSQVLECYFKTYILTCYLNIFMHKNLYTHCIHYVSDNQTLPWWLSGKESACKQETWVQSPSQKDSLGEGNGNPLQPREIPWIEYAMLQYMGSQKSWA